MEEDEFLEMQQDVLEIFQEDVVQTCEYHKIVRGGPAVGGSPINEQFGFIDQDNTGADADPDKTITDVTELLFAFHEQASHMALVKRLGVELSDFRVNYEIAVFIPTLELINKNVVLERDAGFLRFADGSEWRMEAIVPVPRMYTSSIITRIMCSRRKPIDDKPGVN